MNFKTGHFALRRYENIVEFFQGRFCNHAEAFLVHKTKTGLILLSFNDVRILNPEIRKPPWQGVFYRWRDSLSSVFYTLIKHAFSTNHSARYI